MAKIDLGSVIGPRGERGAIIYQGTAITGTETEGTVFSDSGIEYALQEDKYLNTLTNDMYTCITEGDADTAEWAWIGNIQGKRGLPGEPGPTGQVDMNTPIEYNVPEKRQDMESGDSLGILMGKIDKSFKDMTESAYLPVVNNLETARAGEGVLDAYQGKALDEKIDRYTSDYFSPAKNYEVGDVCIYNNKLYKFTSKKEAGEWNEDAVEITNIGNYVSELNGKIGDNNTETSVANSLRLFKRINTTSTANTALTNGKNYLAVAYSNSHFSSLGLYLISASTSSKGVKTVLASNNITDLSINTNNTLTMTTTTAGSTLNIYEIDNGS